MKITMPGEETIKLVVAVILGCLLLYAGQKVLEWREGAQENEQRGRTMEATTGIVQDGQASDEARREADAGTAQARDEFETKTEEDRKREPQTAARDTGVVPASRLRAFEARRAAREKLANERLGRAGVEREDGPGPPDPPER